MEPAYSQALDKYQDELRERIMSSFGIPPELMKGGNYSSSRIALDMFERTCGFPQQSEVGGTWLGEVQSP